MRKGRTGYDYDFVFTPSVSGVSIDDGEMLKLLKSEAHTYGPVESGATLRMRGMFSKVPASGASCCVIASRRRWGAEVMEDVYNDVFRQGCKNGLCGFCQSCLYI